MVHINLPNTYKPHREKTCFLGFQLGQTQTRLYSHRSWLKACRDVTPTKSLSQNIREDVNREVKFLFFVFFFLGGGGGQVGGGMFGGE